MPYYKNHINASTHVYCKYHKLRVLNYRKRTNDLAFKPTPKMLMSFKYDENIIPLGKLISSDATKEGLAILNSKHRVITETRQRDIFDIFAEHLDRIFEQGIYVNNIRILTKKSNDRTSHIEC